MRVSIRDNNVWFGILFFVVLSIPWMLPLALAEYIAVDDVTINQSSRFFDRGKGVYFTLNRVTNNSPNPITGPLRLVVQDSSLPVVNADGQTASNKPFFTISDAEDFELAVGTATDEIRIEFQRLRIPFEVVLRVENDVEPVDEIPRK